MISPRHHTTAWPTILFALALLVLPSAALARADGAQHEPEPWIRLVEDDDTTLHLDIGMRTFEHVSGEGPTITLVGAVHIGARPYYRALQRMLDNDFDLVLYEGVNPEGTGSAHGPELSDRDLVERTRNRIRLVAILLERVKREKGSYPESLDALAASLADNQRASTWLKTARIDAWGNPLNYTPNADRSAFRLVSHGSDGRPGGRGHASDLDFAQQRPLNAAELGNEPGLQARLARTFRLSFQLEEMHEDGDHWVNSDMSIDEINRRVEAEGGDGSMLFGMLDGSGGMMRLAGAMLTLVEAIPGAAQRGQLMIMEMLSQVDDLESLPGMPGGEALLRVIIRDRNQVVIDDLREFLSQENPPTRIAVLYGAGHMPDLEQRMLDQLGYRPAEPMRWNTSMRLNLERAGIPRMEHMMLRGEIRRQLDAARAQETTGSLLR